VLDLQWVLHVSTSIVPKQLQAFASAHPDAALATIGATQEITSINIDTIRFVICIFSGSHTSWESANSDKDRPIDVVCQNDSVDGGA
jgi:hypothetical protein